MSERNTQQGGSPIGGQELFANQGDGPAATWLGDGMWEISNTPPSFQSTFNSLMKLETAASPAFRGMMEAQVEAEDKTPRAVGRNQHQSEMVMTPDEVTGAHFCFEFQDNPNSEHHRDRRK